MQEYKNVFDGKWFAKRKGLPFHPDIDSRMKTIIISNGKVKGNLFRDDADIIEACYDSVDIQESKTYRIVLGIAVNGKEFSPASPERVLYVDDEEMRGQMSLFMLSDIWRLECYEERGEWKFQISNNTERVIVKIIEVFWQDMIKILENKISLDLLISKKKENKNMELMQWVKNNIIDPNGMLQEIWDVTDQAGPKSRTRAKWLIEKMKRECPLNQHLGPTEPEFTDSTALRHLK